MKEIFPVWSSNIKKSFFTNFFLFIGMDLLKHGESAYPADAWVEQQYMKEDAFSVSSWMVRDMVKVTIFGWGYITDKK